MSYQKKTSAFRFFIGFIALALVMIAGTARADKEDFETDLGRFATWDSEAGTLAAAQGSAAGYSGGGMVLSNTAAGAAGVEHYAVAPNTTYMVTAWIQVQSGGTSPFAFAMMLKSGQWDANDAGNNPGTWFIPGFWGFGTDTTAGTRWSETDNDWKIIGMSIVTGPSDTVLSLGFALGGSGAPDVHVDDVHVTRPYTASVIDFDEDPYVAWDNGNGYRYDQAQIPPVGLLGAVPTIPTGIRMYIPTWMGTGVGDGIAESTREVSLVESGAAWRIDRAGDGFSDGSPAIPLGTTAGTIYTVNFWMVRDRDSGGNAWTNWADQYESHVAWRLADDPSPGDIEGWPGAIRPNAFHVICEGSSNSQRNYAPDVYAPELTPGDPTSIDCADPTGSRYSTMAFQAVDNSSWFEACIRSQKPGGSGGSFWVMDDMQLLVHGAEDLVPPQPTPTVTAGVPESVFQVYR